MVFSLIGMVLVGGAAGWIAGQIMKARVGLLACIVLGIVGAIVANLVLGLLGIYSANALVPRLVISVAGACGLIWVMRRVKI